MEHANYYLKELENGGATNGEIWACIDTTLLEKNKEFYNVELQDFVPFFNYIHYITNVHEFNVSLQEILKDIFEGYANDSGFDTLTSDLYSLDNVENGRYIVEFNVKLDNDLFVITKEPTPYKLQVDIHFVTFYKSPNRLVPQILI